MISRAIAFFKRIWSAAPIATVILALAVAASLFFGVRSAVFWAHHRPFAEREQAVAAWMTPRYISRSWQIPPDVLLDALDAPRPPPDGPMNLSELADYRGVPVEQVIAEAEAAIAASRGGNPMPDGGPEGEIGSSND